MHANYACRSIAHRLARRQFLGGMSAAAAVAKLPARSGRAVAAPGGAHCRRRCATRWASSSAGAGVGVVFDIDGVLQRGKAPVPGAAEALRKLRRARVPHVFVTNNGGRLESHKCEQLNAVLGEQVCTPAQVRAPPLPAPVPQPLAVRSVQRVG